MGDVVKSRRLDAKSLLLEVRNGDAEVAGRLMSVLYADLRRIVRGVMASEGYHHALQPAAVVNEALWALFPARRRLTTAALESQLDWQSRAYFLALAARQMRLVLADYNRRRSAAKTAAPLTIALKEAHSEAPEAFYGFAVIDRLLQTWARTDAALARVLEMDCFAGMSDSEIALVEHTSTAQAKKDRDLARNRIAEAAAAHPLGVSNL